jgi:hypothetical protein
MQYAAGDFLGDPADRAFPSWRYGNFVDKAASGT